MGTDKGDDFEGDPPAGRPPGAENNSVWTIVIFAVAALIGYGIYNYTTQFAVEHPPTVNAAAVQQYREPESDTLVGSAPAESHGAQPATPHNPADTGQSPYSSYSSGNPYTGSISTNGSSSGSTGSQY